MDGDVQYLHLVSGWGVPGDADQLTVLNGGHKALFTSAITFPDPTHLLCRGVTYAQPKQLPQLLRCISGNHFINGKHVDQLRPSLGC